MLFSRNLFETKSKCKFWKTINLSLWFTLRWFFCIKKWWKFIFLTICIFFSVLTLCIKRIMIFLFKCLRNFIENQLTIFMSIFLDYLFHSIDLHICPYTTTTLLTTLLLMLKLCNINPPPLLFFFKISLGIYCHWHLQVYLSICMFSCCCWNCFRSKPNR